jgi:hypothetical protein
MAWTRAERDAAKAKLEADKADREEKEENILLDLEEKHGLEGDKLAVCRTDKGMVVMTMPLAVVWKRFASLKEIKPEDVDRFVRPCVIYPSKEEFNALVDNLPASLIQCGDALATLAGVRREK